MATQPEAVTPSMSGKTCLVTGATSGIGLVTARALASAGANVYLVGRNAAKSEETTNRIRQEANNPSVDFFVADLSSQEEIRRLASDVRDRIPKLDVLLNNAGAMFSRRQETVDGIERTWALNHLAYFLLTNLLIDPLKAAGRARVVNVASDAHRVVPGINFADPEFKDRYRAFRAYGQSKLANILFSNELARRLEGTGVTSNSLHPGFVATSFMDGNGTIGWAFRVGARLIAISPEKGARTSILLATSPELEGISGKYFEKGKVARPRAAALDLDAAQRLWRLSEEMTGAPVSV
jgi:NAD(P)-dependent dehydrogenase (short-subunit alcohol dehydrogenase family)